MSGRSSSGLTIPAIEREILTIQMFIMAQYREILNQRILRFGGDDVWKQMQGEKKNATKQETK